MKYTIEFLKEDYDYLMKVIKTGEIDDGDDCGYINIGAVNCELSIRDYYANGNRFYGKYGICLDANFYLLGKDTGYGEIDKIPYSHEDGFYVEVKDTYEETLEQLLKEIEEYINDNADLLKGSKETELTWDKEE